MAPPRRVIEVLEDEKCVGDEYKSALNAYTQTEIMVQLGGVDGMAKLLENETRRVPETVSYLICIHFSDCTILRSIFRSKHLMQVLYTYVEERSPAPRCTAGVFLAKLMDYGMILMGAKVWKRCIQLGYFNLVLSGFLEMDMNIPFMEDETTGLIIRNALVSLHGILSHQSMDVVTSAIDKIFPPDRQDPVLRKLFDVRDGVPEQDIRNGVRRSILMRNRASAIQKRLVLLCGHRDIASENTKRQEKADLAYVLNGAKDRTVCVSTDCDVSEASLGKPLQICPPCRCAVYCSRKCQLSHWKEHKVLCKVIRAS